MSDKQKIQQLSSRTVNLKDKIKAVSKAFADMKNNRSKFVKEYNKINEIINGRLDMFNENFNTITTMVNNMKKQLEFRLNALNQAIKNKTIANVADKKTYADNISILTEQIDEQMNNITEIDTLVRTLMDNVNSLDTNEATKLDITTLKEISNMILSVDLIMAGKIKELSQLQTEIMDPINAGKIKALVDNAVEGTNKNHRLPPPPPTTGGRKTKKMIRYKKNTLGKHKNKKNKKTHKRNKRMNRTIKLK